MALFFKMPGRRAGRGGQADLLAAADPGGGPGEPRSPAAGPPSLGLSPRWWGRTPTLCPGPACLTPPTPSSRPAPTQQAPPRLAQPHPHQADTAQPHPTGSTHPSTAPPPPSWPRPGEHSPPSGPSPRTRGFQGSRALPPEAPFLCSGGCWVQGAPAGLGRAPLSPSGRRSRQWLVCWSRCSSTLTLVSTFRGGFSPGSSLSLPARLPSGQPAGTWLAAGSPGAQGRRQPARRPRP